MRAFVCPALLTHQMRAGRIGGTESETCGSLKAERRKQQCRRGDPSLPSLGLARPLALVQNRGHGSLLSFPLQDEAGLAGKVKEGGGHKDRGTVPRVGPPRLAPQVRATSSKWERFLLPPGNGPRADMEPSLALQRDPKHAEAALAEQGTLWVQTPREGHPSRPLGAPKLPWPAHTFTSGSQRPCVKPSGQPQDTGPLAKGSPLVTGVQESPLVRPCDLFKTGEDFEDDL